MSFNQRKTATISSETLQASTSYSSSSEPAFTSTLHATSPRGFPSAPDSPNRPSPMRALAIGTTRTYRSNSVCSCSTDCSYTAKGLECPLRTVSGTAPYLDTAVLNAFDSKAKTANPLYQRCFYRHDLCGSSYRTRDAMKRPHQRSLPHLALHVLSTQRPTAPSSRSTIPTLHTPISVRRAHLARVCLSANRFAMKSK